MKDHEFTKCPMCEGVLEFRMSLDHPKHGLIDEIPNHHCLQCGEIFLSGEACDLIDQFIEANALA